MSLNTTPDPQVHTSPTIPASQRSVLKGFIGNAIEGHRNDPYLATRVTGAVVEALGELNPEQYPGELEHLRGLLREVCRLSQGDAADSPLAQILIDHYSDPRIVDAQLAEGGAS